jgi:protein-disulfide isomerase
MNFILPLSLVVGIFFATSCTSDQKIKDQVVKVIQENPKILADAIEKHPVEILTALQNASKTAQEELAKQRDVEERKALEETFSKPLTANIRKDESILGPKDAPLTLVEYSDFECQFCARGYDTVKNLMQKYEGKIRFVYKHLPLSFHPQAMISAQYYEAIRLQDEKKAFAFHDEVFKNQPKLSSGAPFLDSVAKKVGADLKKLKQDINSPAVAKRIEDDVKEAGSLGMQGTPGFLINGVPVRGAYPTDHFVGIIDELQKRGKVKI